MTKSNKTTFEAPEGFLDALGKEQRRTLGIWLAANPTARIEAIDGVVAEGELPAHIRKPEGRRADINRMMTKGMTVKAFLPLAARLGGGHTDIIAALNGGYGPSSTTWGRPAIRLLA
tara:strand:- start:171 stop:521 length:351 start_codon:yes stop_codon:yes gene_type:complete